MPWSPRCVRKVRWIPYVAVSARTSTRSSLGYCLCTVELFVLNSSLTASKAAVRFSAPVLSAPREAPLLPVSSLIHSTKAAAE